MIPLYKNVVVRANPDGTETRLSMMALPPFTYEYPGEPGSEIICAAMWFWLREQDATDKRQSDLHGRYAADSAALRIETWRCTPLPEHPLMTSWGYGSMVIYSRAYSDSAREAYKPRWAAWVDQQIVMSEHDVQFHLSMVRGERIALCSGVRFEEIVATWNITDAWRQKHLSYGDVPCASE